MGGRRFHLLLWRLKAAAGRFELPEARDSTYSGLLLVRNGSITIECRSCSTVAFQMRIKRLKLVLKGPLLNCPPSSFLIPRPKRKCEILNEKRRIATPCGPPGGIFYCVMFSEYNGVVLILSRRSADHVDSNGGNKKLLDMNLTHRNDYLTMLGAHPFISLYRHRCLYGRTELKTLMVGRGGMVNSGDSEQPHPRITPFLVFRHSILATCGKAE